MTVADSVEMTRFGIDADGYTPRSIATFSPDGKQFVVVLRKGNLRNNTNRYSLLLFKAAEVFRSPKPRMLLAMSSSSNRPAIHNVVWLNDNDTLLFLGEHPGETSQLYSYRCSSRKLTRLTNHSTNLTLFVSTPAGSEIAYVAESPAVRLANEKVARSGFNVTHEVLYELISGAYGGGVGGEHLLFVKRAGSDKETRIKLEGSIDYLDESVLESMLAFSPNGEFLLIQTRPPRVPAAWSGYEDRILETVTHHPPTREPQSTISQYELVDTRTGARTVLLDAPISPQGSELAWSPDGKSVVVSNMYLPLNVEDPEEQKLRESHTFLVEYSVSSRRFVTMSDEDLRLLAWDPRTGVVTCDVGRMDSLTGKNPPKAYFRRSGDAWSRVNKPETRPGSPPEIIRDEDLNTPPRIVVRAAGGQRKTVLLDLNPQLRDVTLAKVEQISWKDTLGDEVQGGLYWPVNYVPEKRYPLVIQTHGWFPNRFITDGPWTTAFAAQPLAGKGFFVLQVSESAWSLAGTPKEAPNAAANYESAIDYLDNRGLIDRNRVGIIGFSRTCYYVTQMLVFSKYPIAAAVIADGVDADYIQYFAFANVEADLGLESEGENGGAPFGDALSTWIQRVSAFHLDQVHTPLRIQAIKSGSLLSEWNWFSGLYSLGKPVDLVYLPEGTHILQKPWDLMVSQQGDVDWFCFWLKGEEDPDPAKAEQYTRWRELRNLNRPVASGQAAP